MLKPLVVAITALAALWSRPAPDPQLAYTLSVDQHELSGVAVTLKIQGAPASVVLAAHAHPEYDDKYSRYVENLRAVDGAGRPLAVSRVDAVRWQVNNATGDVTVSYRVRYPSEGAPRSSWRPFLAPSGGLVGGPHSFLYVVGQEDAPASVNLEIPRAWKTGTGLSGGSTARAFTAPDIFTLMESPMLVGELSEWGFDINGVRHRVFYWKQPGATPFDTIAFVNGVERMARKTVELFGRMPYREYTFLFQDGAFAGGLEHPNSVTLGAQSAELARDPYAILRETAHEFIHTWNLMAIKPIEYRKVDYRPQPPVAGLWFSEGLTIFYADLLRRRAGIPLPDSTRLAHLEDLIEYYLSNPGNARFSAEQVSRVAYNAPVGALGDYTASSHLQGELIGTILDIKVRDATDGARSMDDVMRLVYERFGNTRGFTGKDIEAAVDEVCRCSSAEIFEKHVRNGNAIDFDRNLAPLGLRVITSWAPALDDRELPRKDLRVWAWQEGDEPFLRLRVTNPESVWGRAGLRTGDQLVSVNDAVITTWPVFRTFLLAFPIGDSATIVVRRPTGRFRTQVVMRGFDEPKVRLDSIAGASARQRRLREAWLRGN